MKKTLLAIILLLSAGQAGCTPRMAAAVAVGAFVGAAVVSAASDDRGCRDCDTHVEHHHHHYGCDHHHHGYDDYEAYTE